MQTNKPKRRCLTIQERELIVEAYGSGVSSAVLSKQYAVSDRCICHAVKRAYAPIRYQKITSDQEKTNAVRAYAEGKSMAVIRKEFRISEKLLLRLLKESNTPIRGAKNQIQEHKDKAVELYESGLTINEVADQLGVNAHNVYYFLRGKGITRNPATVNKLTWNKSHVNVNRRAKLRLLNSRQKGNANASWKGGITPLVKVIRGSEKSKQWRNAIFARDNYTCQSCGRSSSELKSGSLQADHIYPFSAIIKEHKIETIEQAEECKQLWNTDNGRTLCIPCHKQTPTYGFKATRYHKRHSSHE
ncbi:HNH endonuclease [Fibrivirga algicola]|uniref:HNH nuclease domain-containing protein n=1 Tax=Fibrivirga algicola TaxID=2950420 RepID=A0ABX0QH14_9BACT|nr:hypothetical protein [Fibrivirga algicola]NID09389.1 hypothetical protein [Fibrivirga algicola]